MVQHLARPEAGKTNPSARLQQGACISSCVLGIAVLIGCGQPADALTLDQTSEPILRGTVDRDHPEVMLLANREGFLCTGTVIQSGEQAGYLLTAAHCVTEEDDDRNVVPMDAAGFLVVPGVDFAESTSAYSVQAIHVAPRYDGSFASDDIAIVRFFFGGAPAPSAIAPLGSSEDELAVGSDVLLVGYGQTEVDDGNTQRRRVARAIEDLDGEIITFSQADGKGACFGDSGGPALVQIGGQPRVAAVVSGGVTDEAGSCAGGVGVAMRVSAFEEFIEGVLAQGSPD
jgi:secreted trypsin-like serine protease